MSLIESLAARRLFSQFGFDNSFASHGLFGLQSIGDVADVVDTGSYLYVAASNGSSARRLTRLTEAGKIDKSWGKNGFAALPFEPVRIAYDSRNGKVCAAGVFAAGEANPDDPSTPDPTGLRVARLTRDGVLDTTYDGDGVADYKPALPALAASVRAKPTHLLVRPHGGLDVGLTITSISQSYYDDGIRRQDSDDSVNVVRLKNNGSRDATFGNRGLVQLSNGFDLGVLRVLNATVDGGLDAVVSTAYGTGGSIDRRAVSITGQVRTAAVFPLPIAGVPDESLYGGESSVVVDANHVYVTDTSGDTLYTVAAGVPAVGKSLVGGLLSGNKDITASTGYTQLLPGTNGGYFAVGTIGPDSAYLGTGVVRLRSDFTVERTWGDRGLLAIGSGDVYPDASGRLLAATNVNGIPVLARFDGRTGTKPVTYVRAGDSRRTNDVLRVSGTPKADRISVRATPDGAIGITINSVTKTYERGNGRSLVIDSGSNDDTIRIDLTIEKALVLGGRGDDSIIVANSYAFSAGTFALSGGAGRETFRLANSVLSTIDGGADADRLLIDDYTGTRPNTVIFAIESRRTV